MRRLLGKLIPRSTGGRWAAGLGVAAVIGVGIYLLFFFFAVHLLIVDEVVDEEGPEFAVEADIDQLISEALESGPAATTAAAGSDVEPAEDEQVTEQSMSVGEHDVEPDGSGESGTSGSSAETDPATDAGASTDTGASTDAGTSTDVGTSTDAGTSTDTDASDGSGEGETADQAADQGVRVTYVGSFGRRSHPAEGTAVVLTDGTQTFLRFDDDFATDNGPDLNVYLHTAGPDAPVGDLGSDFIDLGDLKGNIGAQNFVIPDGIDLDRYSTVSVWCVRFGVVFGTAELAPMN